MTTPDDTTLATYDRWRPRWAFLHDSFAGGERYRAPSAALLGGAKLRWASITEDGRRVEGSATRQSYLVPHPGESDAEFDARLALAAYVNVVAPVVKAYAEGCTARVQRTAPGLEAVTEDANRHGGTWAECAEEAAQWAALDGLAFAVVDAPRASGAVTRADELAAGVRPYVVVVQAPAVAWTRVDGQGRLVEFAYTDTPFAQDTAPAAAQQTQPVRVRVWRADTTCVDEETGRETPVAGGWEVRAGSVRGDSALAGQASALRLVASGPLPACCAGEIPVEPLMYARDTGSVAPLGTGVAEDTADLARLIYNTLSWISEIHRKAAFPFLAIPMGATGGQLDPQAQIAIGPGKGLGYNATAGAPSWVSPSSDSPKELREHALFLFMLALRVAGLEVAADASAQVTSGLALRIRSRDFESRASRFARNLARWELKTLRWLARFAGVDPAEIAVQYPKRFTLPDLAEDLERALALLTTPIEIGATLKREAIKQAADAALALTDEQLADALAELDALFAADVEVGAAERGGRLAELADKLAKLKGVAPTGEAA